MPKKIAAPKIKDDGLSFEQAIARLEQLVAEMESADLPLDQLLAKYEEGTKLVRLCGQKLDEAEKKIELLTKKTDGTVALEPLADDEAATESPDAEEGQLL